MGIICDFDKVFNSRVFARKSATWWTEPELLSRVLQAVYIKCGFNDTSKKKRLLIWIRGLFLKDEGTCQWKRRPH